MPTTFKSKDSTHVDWTLDSWRQYKALQQPTYRCESELKNVTQELARMPGIVTYEKILQLKKKLAQAQQGQLFILQGGDCAESFNHCDKHSTASQLKVLQHIGQVLTQGLQIPVLLIGRLAGQYAKPRSIDFETKGKVQLPVYRGDIINHSDFSDDARRADPQRILQAYSQSVTIMGHIRTLNKVSMNNLLDSRYRDLQWLKHNPYHKHFVATLNELQKARGFTHSLATNVIEDKPSQEVFISHEALLLEYEQALTRRVSGTDLWVNLSTHFPWIGKRTVNIHGAHVEFMRGIENPIAIKVDDDLKPKQLTALVERLNPYNEPGRLTLIHRMGAMRIHKKLPPLLDSIQCSGAQVLWLCDPMHGNTETLPCGTKTRRFDQIVNEITAAFAIHAQQGTRLGGLHLEVSGDSVTECIGGACGLDPLDLKRSYQSKVDPRLNYEQALELALRISIEVTSQREDVGN